MIKDCIVEYIISFPYNNQTYKSECFIRGVFSVKKLEEEIFKRFNRAKIIEAYVLDNGKKIKVV